MFDRMVVMTDQRSKCVFLSDLPSHIRVTSDWEWECKSDLGECCSQNSLSQFFSGSYKLFFKPMCICSIPRLLERVGVSCLQHHGGTGLLPGSGAYIFFCGDASIEGRSGGTGWPGIDERLLLVCVRTATMSGTGRIHWHGYLPPHSSGVLQLPAMEEGKRGCKRQRIKEEKVRKSSILYTAWT